MGQPEAVLPALLTARDVAFKAGLKCLAGLHTAELSRAIRGAKLQRAQTVQNYFANSVDWRHTWWVFQTLTDQKTPLQASNSVTQLPDSLNDFYAQFEAPHNTSHPLPPTLDPLRFANCPNWSTDDVISCTLHYLTSPSLKLSES